MKPATYRITLLISCAAFALSSMQATAATDAGPPSIEIHLEALGALDKASAADTTAAPASKSPFGPPTPAPVHAASANAETPVPAHNAKAAGEKKSAAHHASKTTVVAEKKHAPKHVASLEKSAPKVKHASNSGTKPHAKHEKAVAAAKPASTLEADDMAIASAAPHHELPPVPVTPPEPKPEEHAEKDIKKSEPALNPDITIVKAEKPPLMTEKPKLPDMPPPAAPAPVEAKAPPPVPAPAAAPKETASSGISGGFSDILSDDAEKPADASKTPNKLLAKTPAPLPPLAKEMTASPPPLAAPPTDLMVPAHADNAAPLSLPAAPNALPPSAPLLPAIDSNADKGTDKKMLMASNDLPPAPTHAPAASELPSLPTPDSEPPREMAQATLTPLPGAPPAQPAKAALPSVPAPVVAAAPPPAPLPPAAAAPAPAPAAPVPPPAQVVTSPASTAAPIMPMTPEISPTASPDLRIPFNESETDVPLGSTDKLDALARKLTGNPTAHVTIMAYASGPETTGIYPKRVSLARGIAVRNYLTSNKGISIERVNVKALGNKNEGGGPGDRVDVFVVK